ncbi:MAG: hypothetical protein P4L99_21875 [Chthoniobacter sp.]|nr:hypothetical protein [Chthoniobacter sp.]
MSTSRLQIETCDTPFFKRDEPHSGEREGLYFVEVLIDGEPALYLTRRDFRATGQMEKFVELLRELIAR